MVAGVRAETNESKSEGGEIEIEIEAGRGNAARLSSSDRKLEDAVQRAMNDLEQERERRESEGRGLTAPRPGRNGSRSSPDGTAPGGGLDCSTAAPARCS
jgi:hypothetical protein